MAAGHPADMSGEAAGIPIGTRIGTTKDETIVMTTIATMNIDADTIEFVRRTKLQP